MMIFDPALGDEKIEKLISKAEEKIKSLGGEIDKTDKWGSKRLASPFAKLKKMTNGYYVVIYFKSDPSVPAKVQSFLKVTENIIRYSVYRSTPMSEQPTGAPFIEEGKGEGLEIGEIKGAEEAFGES
jgi:small subunit ribosomal protein S6